MRRVPLHPHPSTPCPAVGSLTVSVSHVPGAALSLGYELAGDLAALRIPAAAAPARQDGLWRHTCFEAFVGAGAARYCEFNFAPSGCWAAYGFDGYRAGMRALELPGAPGIVRRDAPGRLCLEADVPLAGLPVLEEEGALRLALSAVIEAADGALSYWALAHPAGRPDFHHRDSFALALGR